MFIVKATDSILPGLVPGGKKSKKKAAKQAEQQKQQINAQAKSWSERHPNGRKDLAKISNGVGGAIGNAAEVVVPLALLMSLTGGAGGGNGKNGNSVGTFSPTSSPYVNSAVDFGTTIAPSISGNSIGNRNTAFGTGGLAGQMSTGNSIPSFTKIISQSKDRVRIQLVDTYPLFLTPEGHARSIAIDPGRSGIPSLDEYGSKFLQYKINSVTVTMMGQGLTLTTIPEYHAVQISSEYMSPEKLNIDCFRSLPGAVVENINNNVSAHFKQMAVLPWTKNGDTPPCYVNFLRQTPGVDRVFISIAVDASFNMPAPLTCTYDTRGFRISYEYQLTGASQSLPWSFTEATVDTLHESFIQGEGRLSSMFKVNGHELVESEPAVRVDSYVMMSANMPDLEPNERMKISFPYPHTYSGFNLATPEYLYHYCPWLLVLEAVIDSLGRTDLSSVFSSWINNLNFPLTNLEAMLLLPVMRDMFCEVISDAIGDVNQVSLYLNYPKGLTLNCPVVTFTNQHVAFADIPVKGGPLNSIDVDSSGKITAKYEEFICFQVVPWVAQRRYIMDETIQTTKRKQHRTTFPRLPTIPLDGDDYDPDDPVNAFEDVRADNDFDI